MSADAPYVWDDETRFYRARSAAPADVIATAHAAWQHAADIGYADANGDAARAIHEATGIPKDEARDLWRDACEHGRHAALEAQRRGEVAVLGKALMMRALRPDECDHCRACLAAEGEFCELVRENGGWWHLLTVSKGSCQAQRGEA